MGQCTEKAVYLLVKAVCQNPVLLLRMKEQTLDVEVEPIFLIGCAFIVTDQYATFNLWVTQEHNLYQEKKTRELIEYIYFHVKLL